MRTNKRQRPLIAGLLAATLGLSLCASLPAADSPPGRPAAAPDDSAAQPPVKISEAAAGRDWRASQVIGIKVGNAQNESLGKIDDLIVDVNNERVAYAILAFGGTLGLGPKLFAYPLSLLQPAAGRNDLLVLNVDKERLKRAPGFARKNWPDWNQSDYRGAVDRYFGPTASPPAMPNQHLVRASELIGKRVDDRQGKRAGQVEDLVVNLGNATIHYAVLEFDKAWSIDDRLLPLPMKSLIFPVDRNKDVLLTVASNELDLSHSFAARKWPDISDPAYQRSVDTYLERTTAAAPRPAGQSGQAGPLREQ